MDSRQCMKCGRELKPGMVFCEKCQAEMEKYPVKPGVVVLLPKQQIQTQKTVKRHRHTPLPLDEQVVRLKKWVIGLSVALLLALSAASIFGWLLIRDWLAEDTAQLLPGQNYSSETSTEPENTD